MTFVVLTIDQFDVARNEGIRARALLSQEDSIKTVKTVIPVNRYSFFEELSDRLLPLMRLLFDIVLEDDSEMIFQNDGTGRRIVVTTMQLWVPKLMLTPEGQKAVNEQFLKSTKWRYLKETLMPSSSRRHAGGQWQITPGVKDAKHVFVFFQQTRRRLSLQHNPYKFDTFDLDDDDSAKLSTCRLQYGATYFSEIDYEGDDRTRIRRYLINYRYRKNDYNIGTQLDVSNYSSMSPVVYIDLLVAKESVTGDEKKLVLYYRLNEAADAKEYTIYAAFLNKEEIVIKEIGNEMVVAS